MVLGASRHHGRYPGVQLVGSQCTWWCWALPDSGLRQESRPDSWSQCTWWCWVLPDPRRVVRCPAWGNGARVATGLRALLGPGRASLIEPGFAQFSQGSPPMGLQGVRAARMSMRPCGSGAVLCSSDTGAQARAMSRQALARRPSAAGWAEAGVVPGLGAPGVPPFSEATTVLPQGPWWPGTVGVVRCYWPCMRDRVVSMEIASLMRRPRVRVTDVMGSEPIAWNSLSVRSPVGA